MLRAGDPIVSPTGWLVELGRLVRFGFIGTLATITYFGTAFASAAVLHFSPVAASVIALGASVFVSYFGHLYVSFRVSPDHRTFLVRFAVVAVSSLLVTTGTTALMAEALKTPYIISLCVVSVLIPATNYLLNRFWVFLPGLKSAAPYTSGSSRTIQKAR
jgi:putative flippase GtrA